MPRRSNALPIDGVLLLDKPGGMTSNSALQRARRLMNARKAGHTGTLDPLATGLLPICFGEATKFGGYLLDSDKGYRAEIRLGERTDTGDAEGQVVERRPVEVDRNRIEQVLAGFRGIQAQVPPMYSALKRDGRPLYELARAGMTVERQARQVCIHELALIDSGPATLHIEVLCSKGTYIRVLAEDIGEALGCGAHIRALRRTRVGPFGIAAGVGIEQLEDREPADRAGLLLPVDILLQDLTRIALPDESARNRFCCGMPIELGENQATDGPHRIYSPDGGFLGVGKVAGGRLLKPWRLVGEGREASPPAQKT